MKDLLLIMNILNVGGAEKVFLEYLKYFSTKAQSIDVLILTKGGTLENELPSNVKVIYLRKNPKSIYFRLSARIYRYFSSDILERVALLMKFYNKKYKTIISFVEGNPVRIHNSLLKKGKYNLSWIHTDMIKNHNDISKIIKKEVEKEFYKKVDKVICVSKDAKKSFDQAFSQSKKSITIYNPINIDDIMEKSLEYEIDLDFRYVCSIGRIEHIKRFDRIIEIAQEVNKLNDEDIRFIIIGYGSEYSILKDIIYKNNLENRVYLLGELKNPIPYIKKSEFLMITSEAEGLPQVMIEALVLSKPVISTNCTGPREVLGEKEYGFTLDYDKNKFSNIVQELFRSNEMKEYYGRKGNNRVLSIINSSNLDELDLFFENEKFK